MNNRFNTFAGWAFFAAIIALGGGILSSKIFHTQRPEVMGYAIEGVEEDGGAAADGPSLSTLLASADIAKGEKVYAKCVACHSINQGGANAIGPNLYGVVGEHVGTGHAGFAFSDALKSKGGSWDFATLDAWLKSPREFAPGTKMTFAGLSKPEDRANLIAYLNAQGSNLPLPTGDAAAPDAAAGDTATTNDAGAADTETSNAAAETAVEG
ncbi:MAG: cytochrome c family protein [Sphingobium sp.]|nr:cytochrome c family protein [Sphingobium sp.]